MTQGSQYAQDGSTWGHSGFGSRGGQPQAHDRGGWSGGPLQSEEPDHSYAGPGQGGGSYGQHDVSPASQRSQWRQEQRSPQFDRAAEPVGPFPRQHAGGSDHDHEPGYVHWRNSRLDSHDRDYRRWRDEQSRKYDEEYGRWRNDRHEDFTRDFHEWRSRREAGAPVPPAQGVASDAKVDAHAAGPGGPTPLTESTNPVESVTDGHDHAHGHGERS